MGLGQLTRNNGSGYTNFSFNHFANPDNMLAQQMDISWATPVPNDVRVCACPVVSNVPDATEKGDLSSDYRSGACQSEDFVDNGYVQGGDPPECPLCGPCIDNPNQCQDIYYLPPGYQEIPNMTVYYLTLYV